MAVGSGLEDTRVWLCSMRMGTMKSASCLQRWKGVDGIDDVLAELRVAEWPRR